MKETPANCDLFSAGKSIDTNRSRNDKNLKTAIINVVNMLIELKENLDTLKK